MITLDPVVVSPYSDDELRARFEQANVLLARGSYADAAGRFDQLVRLSPNGETALPSLYNAALAYEASRERGIAVDRYQELVRRFPSHAAAKTASDHLCRLYAYLERWNDLVATADSLLIRDDLSILEAIQAYGSRALGLADFHHPADARRAIGRARDLADAHRIGESGAPPVELALVSFALGEVRRMASETIVFVPLPRDFPAVLELRCQALLDAQRAYMEAMRSLDAHWSIMAGFRIGQLYQHLHRDVMAIPPPPAADTDRKRKLFEGAMRVRYKVLLEKGLKMMTGTVRLGSRTGEDSAWAQRAEEANRELELALEEQKNALASLPFSEAELTEALDLLRHAATR